jgi:hypothetical protein
MNASSTAPGPRWRPSAAAILLACLALPAWAATRPVNASKAADPAGTVEIVNVEGSVEVSGWNQPLVEVTGSIGEKVERVDVTGSANHTTVRVVVPSGNSWGGRNAAHLKIHVPQGSSLDVSLVSAELRVTGVNGNQQLQTVSGDIQGDAGGELQVSTVSGDVHLTMHHSHNAQLKTVSGDVEVSGIDGELQLNTVSGDAKVSLAALTRAHLETVSGDVTVAAAALGAQGQVDAASVSGDLQLNFASPPDADIDVQSLSGEIKNCYGPKPVEQHYGPGSRLNFRSGKGGGRIHIDTQSGDVGLCSGK